MPTRSWSIACWRRRTTASAGAGTGSTSPAMPTPRAVRGEDPVRATAWKYRDYVIRSFNADKPFDQFIREQLAGDEMVKPPYANLPPADLDKLIATGFLRMAPDGTASAGIDPKLARNQVVADTLQIVSTSLLGLTVRLRPVPQPSLRSDPAGRLLPAARRLRAGARREELAAAGRPRGVAVHATRSGRRPPRSRRRPSRSTRSG